MWQNDRNIRTFWFVKLLEHQATPKNVKDLIIGRQILMGIGEKHSTIPLKITTHCFTHLKLCKHLSDFLPTHPWLPQPTFKAFLKCQVMSGDIKGGFGALGNVKGLSVNCQGLSGHVSTVWRLSDVSLRWVVISGLHQAVVAQCSRHANGLSEDARED